MDPIIKVLVLKSASKVLVTQIKEIPSELGEPDCQLTDPVEFKEGDQDWKERLQRWPGKQLTQNHQCMISSDAILTIVDPQPELLEAYQEVIS